jgi:hypothetical protein
MQFRQLFALLLSHAKIFVSANTFESGSSLFYFLIADSS